MPATTGGYCRCHQLHSYTNHLFYQVVPLQCLTIPAEGQATVAGNIDARACLYQTQNYTAQPWKPFLSNIFSASIGPCVPRHPPRQSCHEAVVLVFGLFDVNWSLVKGNLTNYNFNYSKSRKSQEPQFGAQEVPKLLTPRQFTVAYRAFKNPQSRSDGLRS